MNNCCTQEGLRSSPGRPPHHEDLGSFIVSLGEKGEKLGVYKGTYVDFLKPNLQNSEGWRWEVPRELQSSWLQAVDKTSVVSLSSWWFVGMNPSNT